MSDFFYIPFYVIHMIYNMRIDDSIDIWFKYSLLFLVFALYVLISVMVILSLFVCVRFFVTKTFYPIIFSEKSNILNVDGYEAHASYFYPVLCNGDISIVHMPKKYSLLLSMNGKNIRINISRQEYIKYKNHDKKNMQIKVYYRRFRKHDIIKWKYIDVSR